ncbi:YcxB family protein [Streptomyces sp. DT2A-34]|uniref:YcxB family protein n=1 Tax=Streptomyces sp. DT2A-34 TaxID=3051182 RepID=UPI00265B72B7|nr:YcxB family protein [Streptomyces sp. DT2A-34]MDO0915120.1 YcxB family protein [Streptomyces sp. DT2A-34]
MVMDMGRDAVQGEVELVYRPTMADLTSALRARMRASRSGRMQRWLPGVLAVLAALQGVVMIAGGSGSVTFVVWALVAAVLLVLMPRFQARQLYRLAERQGTCRSVVSDSGVSVATDHTTTTVDWAVQPRFAETPDLFVLLSGDRNAVAVTVLPKRGIQDPADADRLREILDRNLTRV